MNIPYKAFAFFDLDGTLLNEHSQITPEISQAIAQLKERKVIPVIASGRTNSEVTEIMKQAGIYSMISMNGQHVVFEGKEIYTNLLSPEICQRMLTMAQKRGDALGFYNSEKIRLTQQTTLAKQAFNLIHSDVPAVDPAFYQNNPVNMLLLLSTDGDEEYHKEFPELTFFRNGPYSIDIIAKGSSKGQGVKEFVKALDLQGIPTYAFGDGLNDIDLFKACDYRIAMGNARDELKKLATFISLKNTENGIIYALKHYNLL